MTTLTAEHINYKAEIKQKTAKPLLWIGLMSIVMFFAGLTSAVIVSRSSASWVSFAVPSMFTVSTVLIILSSITYQLGLSFIKKNKTGIANFLISITMLLGISFGLTQFLAWSELYNNGIVFSGNNPAGSYFYAITALHLLHVLGGIISLIVVFINSVREKYNAKNNLGVQVSITYWHFLGALWVYLFFFLRFIA